MSVIKSALFAVVLLAASGCAQTSDLDTGGLVRPASGAVAYVPPTPRERLQRYVRETFGPFAWLRSAATAGFSQWEDDPPEWPQGMRGYSYRVASKMGRFAIQETMELGAGAALGEDSRYFRCACDGTWRRTWYAARHALTARNREGKERFAYARTGAIFGAAAVSVFWYPTGYSPALDGLQFGATSLASRAGLNVFKEFWPDIRRKVFRRK